MLVGGGTILGKHKVFKRVWENVNVIVTIKNLIIYGGESQPVRFIQERINKSDCIKPKRGDNRGHQV